MPIVSIDNKAKEDIQLYPKWNIKSYTLSVVSIDDYIIDMAVGINHTIILTNKGRVFTIGNNDFISSDGVRMPGVLGVDSLNVQGNILNDITNIFDLEISERIIRVFLSENNFKTFVLTNKNRVFGWGLNIAELGGVIDAKMNFNSKPMVVKIELDQEEQIRHFINFAGTTFITNKNRIIMSKSSNFASTTNTNYKHNKEIIKVANSSSALMFLDSSGDLFIYGYNTDNLLGSSGIVNYKEPTKINLNLLITEKIKDIQMSFKGVYVLTTFNRLFVWGDNRKGNLVIEKILAVNEPLDVTSQLRLESNESIVSINAMNHYLIVGTDKNNYYRYGRKIDNVGETKSIFKFEIDFVRIFSDPVNFDTFVLYENGFTSNKDLNFKLFLLLTKSGVVEVNVKHGTKMSEISSLNNSLYLLGDYSVVDGDFTPKLNQFIYRVNR
jgi:alpha-tubulin suppressor-like RCC1 family protein